MRKPGIAGLFCDLVSSAYRLTLRAAGELLSVPGLEM